MSNRLTRDTYMNFHQILFNAKGWNPSTIFAKVCLISVVRSDMTRDRKYCQGFYHKLVVNLDRLEFQRGRGSIDLNESTARLLLHKPTDEANSVIIDTIRHGRRPLIFYCENTPINEHSTREFAEKLCGLIGEPTYVIMAQDPDKEVCTLTIYRQDQIVATFNMVTKNKVTKIVEEKANAV